jgi:phage-related protein
MSSYLILTDRLGNVYNLPADFWIQGSRVSARISMSERAYANGGDDIGDGKISSRELTVTGHIVGDDWGDSEDNFHEFYQAIIKGGYLSMYSDSYARRITVKYREHEEEWQIFPTLRTITVTFICESPYWEDAEEIVDDNILAGNDTFVIDTTGTDDIINPIIEIIADQSEDLPSIKLRNLSDGGVWCEYNDPLFVEECTLVVDGKTGTVKMNNNDGMFNFRPAVFLRLIPGENTITYEGGACTINFKYRKLYI